MQNKRRPLLPLKNKRGKSIGLSSSVHSSSLSDCWPASTGASSPPSTPWGAARIRALEKTGLSLSFISEYNVGPGLCGPEPGGEVSADPAIDPCGPPRPARLGRPPVGTPSPHPPRAHRGGVVRRRSGAPELSRIPPSGAMQRLCLALAHRMHRGNLAGMARSNRAVAKLYGLRTILRCLPTLLEASLAS